MFISYSACRGKNLSKSGSPYSPICLMIMIGTGKYINDEANPAYCLNLTEFLKAIYFLKNVYGASAQGCLKNMDTDFAKF